MYCKSVGDPCDPLSFRWPTPKYAATQFWVATHGLGTQGLYHGNDTADMVSMVYLLDTVNALGEKESASVFFFLKEQKSDQVLRLVKRQLFMVTKLAIFFSLIVLFTFISHSFPLGLLWKEIFKQLFNSFPFGQLGHLMNDFECWAHRVAMKIRFSQCHLGKRSIFW